MAAKVSIIAAVAANGIIGAKNKLPWRIPEDLRNFKRLTLGHPVVMGRKTFDSIGKPLPGRRNIVITRSADLRIDGCEVVGSLPDAIRAADSQNAGEIFIIGGAQIYAQAMRLADRLYLTEIDGDAKGDVFFPRFSREKWAEIKRDSRVGAPPGAASARFDFVVYEKTRAAEK